MRSQDFMREAMALAEKAAEMGEVPVGAVVVKKGEIIGRGYNTRETENSILGHAEINAINEASKALPLHKGPLSQTGQVSQAKKKNLVLWVTGLM